MTETSSDLPSVSVIIPHYGDPALALRLIDQLRAEDYPNLQVVVADDCAPDSFPRDVPGVTVFRRPRNGGFGSAVNSGAALASGQLLLIMNNDSSIERGFVRAFVEASAPFMPALTAPSFVDDWSAWDAPAGLFPTPLGATLPRLRWYGRVLGGTEIGARMARIETRARPGACTIVDWLPGAVMLLPRDHFERVGGFDEGFFMFSEEVDLQRRLKLQGVPAVLVATVRANHIGGASTANPNQLRWRMESVAYFFRKWGGLTRYRLLFSVVLLCNFAWDLIARLSGRKNQPVKELRDWLALVWVSGRPQGRG